VTKLYIIHELAAEDLVATISFLADKLNCDVELLHLNSAWSFIDGSSVLILHLALDKEIETHKLISERLLAYNVEQFNPYDRLAEIADDKYLFYEYMLAAEIPQAATSIVSRGSINEDELKSIIHAFANVHGGIVLKPSHGTEKIDYMQLLDMDILDIASEHAQKVLSYDDLILQKYISADAEYRVLYIDGKLFSKTEFPSEFKSQVQPIIDALPIKPRILALDILSANGILIPLEANIRPAGIHRCQFVI
jgi:hypothetical protein